MGELRAMLARQFELSSLTIRVELQRPGGRWDELGSLDDVRAAAHAQQEWWVSVRVSGPVPFSSPLFLLSTLLSLATFVVSAVFVLTHEWEDGTPPMWRAALACLPVMWVGYSVLAAYSTLADEYRTNPKLRTHFDAVGSYGGLALLVGLGFFGPPMLLLGGHLLLTPFCAELSERCKDSLERWSIGMHAILDVPVLLIAIAVQGALQAPWDPTSKLTVGLCAASLLINLPANISKTRLGAGSYTRID